MKNKGIKSSGTTIKLVLGKDITMSQVVNMENIVVVGKARGWNFGIKTIQD
jgi:hypothetical protein